MPNYLKGKCTPPGNAKLFQMGFFGQRRKNNKYRFGQAICSWRMHWTRNSENLKSLDISTDFETLNKQETQQQIDIILSFVESLGVSRTKNWYKRMDATRWLRFGVRGLHFLTKGTQHSNLYNVGDVAWFYMMNCVTQDVCIIWIMTGKWNWFSFRIQLQQQRPDIINASFIKAVERLIKC